MAKRKMRSVRTSRGMGTGRFGGGKVQLVGPGEMASPGMRPSRKSGYRRPRMRTRY